MAMHRRTWLASKNFALAFGILVGQSALAQYITVASTNTGAAIVGACGKPLPAEQSRLATNMKLLCGGAQVSFNRDAIKSPLWDEWSVLERSDAAGSLETRKQMQAVRLREEPIKWTGQTSLKTFETWSWSIRKRGANPQHCRSWVKQVACTKTRPIKKYICQPDSTEAPSHSPTPGGIVPVAPGARNAPPAAGRNPRHDEDRGSSSAKPPRAGDAWDAGAGKAREKGPDTGGRMDADKHRESYGDYKQRKSEPPNPAKPPDASRRADPPRAEPAKPRSEPSKSRSDSSPSKGSGGSNRRTWLQEFSLFPKAIAETCAWVTVGQQEYQGTCEETVVDTCEWEEEQQASRECGEIKVDYEVGYAKPDPSAWGPTKPGYHDLLPNKYDLLPGEWEKVHLLLNANATGKSETVTPTIQFESQGLEDKGWNTYQVQFAQPQMRCHLQAPVSVQARINTVGRIVRKAPNALAIPIDRLGREKALLAAEKFIDGSKKVRLRPYKIQLVDNSNQVMMTAARQSRKFKGLDASAVTSVEHESPSATPATAKELGFWKNTLVKIKLIEKNNCLFEGDKLFADVLDTSSKLTKAEGDKLVVQLDGQQPGVPSFYQPFGFIGRFLGFFYGRLDLYPTPGRAYEFRISMLQQGLPFYENGCKDGAKTCDQKDAVEKTYSDELVIGFTAEEGVDERSWLQTYENWHGRKPWNKLSTCK